MDRLTVAAIRDRSLELAALTPSTPQPTSQNVVRPQAQSSSRAQRIDGKLYLDPKLSAQFKPTSTLFIIVRGAAPEGQKGPLIASTKRDRLTLKDFPLSYAVTQNDSMMGAPLSGKVMVSARLDQDGDAISKQPGDLVGSAGGVVVVGEAPVDIVLNSTL